LFAVILLSLGGVMVWNVANIVQETKAFPAPGQLYEVDGRQMHLYCTGSGSPTVVLEGGVPEWSLHWRVAQPEIAKFTRVCSYDRSGYGWSEAGEKPRSAQKIVDELDALLQAAGEKPPYVLVAHSFWGPAALLYQHDHPDQVAGMVLVESWSPQLFLQGQKTIAQSASLIQNMATLAKLGQVRFLNDRGILPVTDMLQVGLFPEDLRPAYKSQIYLEGFWNAWYDEYHAMKESAQQLTVVTTLGDLPLKVMVAGQRAENDFPPQAAWEEVQKDLLSLSTNSERIDVPDSGHFIQLEQPNSLVEAIRQVVDQVKK
jgi:pimeloyl-ACP methyl ester carboxylesterase